MDEQGWHLSVDSSEKLDQQAQDRLANLKSVAGPEHAPREAASAFDRGR
jgi:hypothetical protein